jgi:hypothetical protein
MAAWSEPVTRSLQAPELPSWRVGDPLPFPKLACTTFQSPEEPGSLPDHPFLYRPALCGTIAQLLCIEDQFNHIVLRVKESIPKDQIRTAELLQAAFHEDIPTVYEAVETTLWFASSIDVYESASAADPSSLWTCRAYIEGKELPENRYPIPKLQMKGGFTLLDILQVKTSLEKGISAQKIWT